MTLHEEQRKVQRAMNAALSGLREDPFLTRRVLANEKGEKNVKKKFAVSVLLIAALTMITAAALAATNWTGITEFLGKIVGGWNVNKSAIVTPAVRVSTSQWLNLTPTEAYWAEDGLSVVLKVDAADREREVCYGEEDGRRNGDGEFCGMISVGGQTLALEDWSRGREVILTDYFPQADSWTWYKRTDAGLYVIVTVMEPDAEALRQGTDLTILVSSRSLQTNAREESALILSLPPMTMQEGHK